MKGPMSYLVRLVDRKLFLIEGGDTVKFLNGMCTQNIPAFTQSPEVSTSALFLNPRGRVLFDTLITKIPRFETQEPAFYLDVHKKQATDFLAHLEKYKLKKEIQLHDLSDFMEIYSVFSESSCPEGEAGSAQQFQEEDVPETPEGLEKAQGYVSFIDPRTPFLGTRSICVGEALELEDQQDVQVGTQEHYDIFRCLQGVPEGPSTFNHIPHFLNFHYLNSLAPSKGCFLGQELVARASANTQAEGKRVLLPCCVLRPEMLDATGKLNSLTVASFVESKGREITGKKVLDGEGKEAGKIIYSLKGVGLAALTTSDIKEGQYSLESGDKVAFWKPMWLERLLHK